MTALGVLLAGGLGAVLRLLVDTAVSARTSGRFAWGIVVVNVSGSFAIGLVAGALDPGTLRTIVATGLLGGYTTFSTASVDAVRLVLDGRWTAALADVLGVLAASVLAAAAGLALGLLA